MEMRIAMILFVLSGIRVQDIYSAMTSSSLKFSVGSRHNVTGHHITKVDLKSDHLDHEPTLDVEVTKSVFGNSQTITISATVDQQFDIHRKGIPQGYQHFPDLGTYKMYTKLFTWADAENECMTEGAHLLVINSKAEADTVKQLWKKQAPTYTTIAWIGFHDQFKEGNYVTVTGQFLNKSGYTDWWEGENTGSTHNCGCIHNTAKLCDYDCKDKFGFICEL